MKRPLVPIGVVACVLLAGSASADVIRLRNGNSLQGEARVLANGDVEVHSAMGVWTVKAARVLEVVQSETAEERVAKALSRRPPLGAHELYELALDVRDEGSVTLALRLAERVVALEPEHEAARRLLGQRRLGESWVSEAEYRSARGEVRYRGEWTSAEAAASALELEAMAAVRDRVDAQRRYQEAQIAALQEERWLRLEAWEREREQQPVYGFPLDGLWGWVGGGVPLFPLLPDPVPGHHGRPPGQVSPPATSPLAPPAAVAPQHNRSSVRRLGD
jgi:hypothetical protein